MLYVYFIYFILFIIQLKLLFSSLPKMGVSLPFLTVRFCKRSRTSKFLIAEYPSIRYFYWEVTGLIHYKHAINTELIFKINTSNFLRFRDESEKVKKRKWKQKSYTRLRRGKGEKGKSPIPPRKFIMVALQRYYKILN